MLDIEDIVRSGSCAGCGLCLSIDTQQPRPQLEMRKTRSGHFRPRFRSDRDSSPAEREALSARVRVVCPGVELPAPAAPAMPLL